MPDWTVPMHLPDTVRMPCTLPVAAAYTTKLPETVSETIPAPRKPVRFLLFLSPAGSQFLAVDTLFSRIS